MFESIKSFGLFVWIVTSLITLGICISARAIDVVDENKDQPKITSVNGITIIEMPTGWTYTLAEIPYAMREPEKFVVPPRQFSAPKYKSKLNALSFGEEIAHDEVVAILDAYYREVAFDYDSIKLRKLEIGERQYAAYCSNYLITCLEWQFRAGTLVEFEMNGRNRNGGMTGFERQLVMLRKVKTG